MLNENCSDAVEPVLSVTRTVNVAVPLAEGFPLMVPEALSLRPLGSAPVIKVQV
jgi:hypothetical protein